MDRKRIAIAAGLCIVAGALALWQVQRPRPDGHAIVLHGNVDLRQVSLAFNATDRIAALYVQEGDHVRAGPVLGEVDSRTLRLPLAQAQALQGAQRDALQGLQTGSRPEEIAQAKANVAAAEAQLELAQQQVGRLRELRRLMPGALSQQDMDSALAQDKVARAQLDNVHNARRLTVIGPRKQDIAQARSQLQATDAAAGLLQHLLSQTALIAPIDAALRARLLEPGDIASPQRPAFTLAITSPKWVRAYVAEADLSRIRPGMAASVTTDSQPGAALPGKVGYIASVAEFTPKTVQTEELRSSLVYEVRILLDDKDDRLRLGMPATVRLDALR